MISSNAAYMDFGNSRVKVLSNDNLLISLYSEDYIHRIAVFLSEQGLSNSSIFYSSVNSNASDTLIHSQHLFGFVFYNVQKVIREQNMIDLSDIQGMGNDRILGLLGALSMFTPPLITIDCGTMITINALDKNKKVLGGAIFPGFSTQTLAAHEHTRALPLLTSFRTEQSIGKNTEDAMMNGIFSACIGGIVYFLERLHTNAIIDNSYTIIVTGGDGHLVYEALDTLTHHPLSSEPNLVLNGIAILAPIIGQ